MGSFSKKQTYLVLSYALVLSQKSFLFQFLLLIDVKYFRASMHLKLTDLEVIDQRCLLLQIYVYWCQFRSPVARVNTEVGHKHKV